ncbi:MAG: phosphoribosylamine--glycine ligase [Parcubacteria group bacterium Greene0416_14]|nr:MAG: phosphoribosylamine--glycine ligase [Parcubacteria group bacterium Greene0416_14]
MKVFVIGSGGREHALLWKLRQSPDVTELYCAPGNAGTRLVAENVFIPSLDRSALRTFALWKRIDLTVIGPELPLALGMTDYFEDAGLTVFGPTQAAAQLEASKVFAKQFMLEENIQTAPFEVFEDAEKAIAYVEGKRMPIVIKPDGLAPRNGVVVCNMLSDAVAAIRACLVEGCFKKAGKRILIENCLSGQEISYHCLVDGYNFLPLAVSQDYKRLYDDNTGPNTGGMGARSPVPNVTDDLLQKIATRIVEPTISGMAKRECEFRGVLYIGIMIVNGEPYVLEYNVRFGDPEAQVLMMRLKSDLFPLLAACACGGGLRGARAEFSKDTAVCLVAASAGYPDASNYKEVPIRGLEKAAAFQKTEIFHSGTRMVRDQVMAADGSGTRTVRDQMMTAGGRVVGITSLARNSDTAARRTRHAMSRISFDGMHYRTGVGV